MESSTTDNLVRVAMWSGPRNLSTALMRSFESRSDTCVTDEPFYGAFLRETGEDHPMREEVIASMECDWHSIARTLSGSNPGFSVWYQKHMAHHMVGALTYEDLRNMRHAFLIRDPARVVASYAAKRDAVHRDHLGTSRQVAFFDREADRLGEAPPVIDSADVRRDPARVLLRLCGALGIAWDSAMLKWKAGPRASDGIWASHWYDATMKSESFAPPETWAETQAPLLTAEQRAVAEACRSDYEYLSRFKI